MTWLPRSEGEQARPSRFTPHPPEVRARASELARSGATVTQIARELGVTVPTVKRWIEKDGPTQQAYSAEEAADAIVRQINTAKRGRKRGPRGARDPEPRTQSQAPAASGPSDAELTDALSEMLCFPAIPAQAFLHCEYCAAHFADTGGPAARELVRLSKDSPGLRRSLITLYGIYRTLMTGGVLGMYVGMPLIHHLAPEQFLATWGRAVGIPPRPGMEHHPDVEMRPTFTTRPDGMYVDSAGNVHAHPPDRGNPDYRSGAPSEPSTAQPAEAAEAA